MTGPSTPPEDEQDGRKALTVAERFAQAMADEGRAPLTVAAYQRAAERFEVWVSSHGGWLALDRKGVTTYLRAFRGAATRRWQGAVIRRLCAWMTAEGEITANPAAAVRSPAVSERAPRALSEAEDRALLAAADRAGGEVALLVALLRRSGMRVGEVVGRAEGLPGLRWGDVDIARRVAKVVGKGGRTAPVYLHDDTVALLAGHRATQRDRRGEARVFGRRSVRWAQRTIASLGKRAGIRRRVTPHMLRHTFATRFLESGGDVRAVQRLLRHRRLATTLLYADYSTDEALRRQFDEHGR